jgi:hypothetical protein
MQGELWCNLYLSAPDNDVVGYLYKTEEIARRKSNQRTATVTAVPVVPRDVAARIEREPCKLYAGYCRGHGFVHGAEAEELRAGIEELIERDKKVKPKELQRLLDSIDARDSLAYREWIEDQNKS